MICVAGHVFGTLLTARVELHAIRAGLPRASLPAPTSGVSYIMVAGLAAAVLVMQRRWQVICGLALAAGVIAPVFISHTVWDLGHLLATLCGLAAAALTLLIAPPRAAPPVIVPGAAGTSPALVAARRAGAWLERGLGRQAEDREKAGGVGERRDPGDRAT